MKTTFKTAAKKGYAVPIGTTQSAMNGAVAKATKTKTLGIGFGGDPKMIVKKTAIKKK